MTSVAELLNDAALTRALLVQRVANGMSRDVAKHYQNIIDEVIERLKLQDDIFTISNAKELISDLKTMVDTDVPTGIYKEMSDFGIEEAKWASSMINTAVGVDIASKVATPARVEAILKTSLIEGATIKDWFSSLNQSMQTDLERSIKQGITMGETNKEITERVQNKLLLSKNQAETITRTAVATVSNQSRDASWEANSKLFRAWEHLSTLDSRVSFVCASRDGSIWDFNTKEGLNDKGKENRFMRPPLHFRCRSILLPVLKNDKELGISSTRASIDGQVADTTTFDKWFSGKSAEFKEDFLGKGRFELYKSGKITFKDLVAQNGRVLSVKELKEKYS